MLEQMRIELFLEGHKVFFITVNASNAVEQQQKLVDKCSFPLLQDTEEINAWALHDGGKDDMYIYDTEGNLVVYLPFSSSGPSSTHLGTTGGYAHVKNAVLDELNTP